ncbi:Gfo/Idh/MocA family protein [Paenibacillus roseipurpureus]|uniref:Gfo/Idh/MocA family oxidoreductase n=1 Tax=Paenibacillus roseopurpureus TaxID=2918901 RepID=A0AA96LTZ3_9BACL|nr:Gfo/Idh/MocA family oxidoreductase [Paenibacillus sp. MBLB1832]WNR46003.1 Gfo/Idh/MocA family oxidoreductase [Paenibacillus sp. MBLB1832]
MSSKLKLGVIGTGNIFRGAHLPVWLGHSEVEIVALCDVAMDKAQAIANQHGISHVYNDYKEMLANEQLDIVDICTSNAYHAQAAICAIEAGAHVLCEKPDATNSADAEAMAAASIRHDRILMAIRNNRFTSTSSFLRKYVDAGHMGDIYTGRCGWIRRRGIPGKGGWFTTKELSGGGPLIDLGVHFIDLAMWLMGNPKPVAVSGATYCKFAESSLSDSIHSQFGEKNSEGTFDVEDLATGFVRFDNGATLQIEFSWASNIEEEMNFLELRGTKAGFSLRNGDAKLFTEIEETLCMVVPQLKKQADFGHASQINHFIDVVRKRSQPIVTPEQGVDMIKLLAGIYESARLGREIQLT